ncbi:alpha-methylacyl-CoA racemase [Cupriavidus metallidurans]|jgi:alpha-methylacyl-CoA racemase|uniref:CaiB/BaiF CoA transferase family protein n=1 Tax=Cupriavidus metallidurans TaxID=119219 RepID=UPI00049396D8|nr:CaiB/BaiF CoA-transferase family protein [Cupriavidus metallidurans]AVA34154.1 CoA transferase [Cupriavidus metallidurans]KWW34996.1 Succinyl-CoA--L-malate CoA-transferase beta subunit [Cupriavidus metallidurans]MDE4922203.1 CaiB/BaiF CoA-transferase family protein [Cupriavidus metallidurans]
MGVLSGIRVIEFEAIGPGPFGAMLLADMGADVLRIDRPVAPTDLGPKRGPGKRIDITGRGRRSVTIDLKQPEGQQAALELIAKADVVIEGFRPGTMERLGLGPAIALARNPRLIYGRMTGWGQTGPMADRAGHDLNYIAMSGVLSGIGRAGEAPVPPLNLVGDYGGGGMLLALGVVSALLNVHRGGKGQVVDAAMLEGAAQLGAVIWGLIASGNWRESRGSNLLDGGTPWYDSYCTRDGQYMSVGAVESRFYAELIEKLGLAGETLPGQHDRAGWPTLRRRFTEVFLTRTRDEWCAIFDGSDACVAPVLTFSEAPDHPQHRARGSFIEVDGVVQPGPAPRFLGTPSEVRHAAPARGQHGGAALREWGFDDAAIAKLRAQGLGFVEAQP